jgi:signal peptidase II
VIDDRALCEVRRADEAAILCVIPAARPRTAGDVVMFQSLAVFLPCIAGAGLALALDQGSKVLALSSGAERRTCVTSTLTPRLRICLNRKAGIALLPRRYLTIILAICVFATLLLVATKPALQGLAAQIGLGFALGGAIGNALDVARHGAVVDFIDFRIWPVFNIADACIVLGAGGTLWSIV